MGAPFGNELKCFANIYIIGNQESNLHYFEPFELYKLTAPTSPILGYFCKKPDNKTIGGGLVFQDKFRLDRLAPIKIFTMAKIRSFFDNLSERTKFFGLTLARFSDPSSTLTAGSGNRIWILNS